MERSLAVVWQERRDESPAHGRLELTTDRIHLEGMCAGRPVSRDVPRDEIAATRFARAQEERLRGRQTLILQLKNRHRGLLISSLFGVGRLAELAELLGG